MPLLERFPTPSGGVVLASLAFLVGYVTITLVILPSFSASQRYLNSTPWVGVKKQWFAKYQAGVRYVKHSRTMFKEGYDKYGKKNLPFVVPQLSSRPLVAIPRDHINVLMNLSDDALSPHEPNRETISADYTTRLRHGDTVHMDVVRRQLTRKLPLLTASVYEELRLAMESHWIANTSEWKTVKAYSTCMAIVSRAANRVFGGEVLCRTPDFLEASREYTVAVFTAGGLIRLAPWFLRLLVAPIIMRRCKVNHYFNVAKKVALPIIKERIALVQRGNATPDSLPVDALQWLVEDCVKLAASDPSQLDDDRMVSRLLMLNMVAIHTTSMVTTNTILDLYSSPGRDAYIAGIREEVQRVLAENGGEYTKTAINNLHRIDSTIRETMRYTPLNDGQLRRQVMAKDGVTLGEGFHLPFGTRTIVPAHFLHRDEAVYGPDADAYDAFRFSRPREAYLADVAQRKDSTQHLKSVLEHKNQAMIATGDDFIAFGHGRHACPGRFFASQEMKLMIAHVVTNYDIEVVGGERMPNDHMNGSWFPSSKAEIRVKLSSQSAK